MILFILFYFTCYAAEVDSFSKRNQPLEDISNELNLQTNSLFQQAIDFVNNKPCQTHNKKLLLESELELYRRLYLTFGGKPIARIEDVLSFGYHHHKAIADQWIYKDANNIYFGIQGKFSLRSIYGKHDGTFNLGGHYIGNDKLGHFFDTGFDYFFISDLKEEVSLSWLKKKQGLDRAQDFYATWSAIVLTPFQTDQISILYQEKQNISFWFAMERKLKIQINKKYSLREIGELYENGLWGLGFTGIYSYADIAANIDGYNFWRNLTRGVSPFISCKDGRWVQNQQFDWRQYVSDAWDEGINCSDYDGKLKSAVEANIRNILFKKHYKEKKCPLSPEKCVSLRSRYRETLFVLHPSCRR